MTFRTRFAPSPTGLLHIGHAYSAILAFDAAQQNNGAFLLRIEDLDQTRCRMEYEDAIKEDLRWLGITWDGPVHRQANQTTRYEHALDKLNAQGLLFPCSCNRRAVREALSAPQEGGAPAEGPDGIIYPGTCRHRNMSDWKPGDALRLNIEKAAKTIGRDLEFQDTGDAGSGTMTCSNSDLI